MNINGQDQKVRMSMTTWFEINASEPNPAGGTTCEITTKRIKSSDNPFGAFDTDDPDSMKDNPFAQIANWQLKYKIVLTYGPNGKFIHARGLEGMFDELARQEPSIASFANQMKETMANTYGPEYLYGNVAAMLPQEPVGVGAIWHNDTSRSMPIVGLIKCDNECEFIKNESTPAGKIAHIKQVGLVQNREGADTNIGPVSMNIKNLNLKITGDIRINTDTGLLILQKQVTAGDMEMSSKDPQGEDMSIKTSANMTTEQILTPIK